MHRILLSSLIVTASAGLPAHGAASTDGPLDRRIVEVPAFLDAQPDLMYRQWGLVGRGRLAPW